MSTTTTTTTKPLQCGSGTSCALQLDGGFWDERYQANQTGWDLGQVSPPLKAYINQLQNKHLRILIPGCGNSYEAEYLLQQGFTDITLIDIAPTLVHKLQQQFAGNPHIRIILGDFFEHKAQYDLILEQTFFCALDPAWRTAYAQKMHQLLAPSSRLVGVLFNREFEQQGPPFGGSREEYRKLFSPLFDLHTFDTCNNSAQPRQGTELFINLIPTTPHNPR